MTWEIDRRLLPLWQRVYHAPQLAQRLVPPRPAGRLDICHWSDSAFLRLPGVAHVMTVHDAIVLRHPEWQLSDSAYLHTRKLRATPATRHASSPTLRAHDATWSTCSG